RRFHPGRIPLPLLAASLLVFLPIGPPTKVSPPSPVAPTPSPAQLAWQQSEYYAFIHFGMNTFTDHECGAGRVEADNFNPTPLDCRPCARLVKAAWIKGVIITA